MVRNRHYQCLHHLVCFSIHSRLSYAFQNVIILFTIISPMETLSSFFRLMVSKIFYCFRRFPIWGTWVVWSGYISWRDMINWVRLTGNNWGSIDSWLGMVAMASGAASIFFLCLCERGNGGGGVIDCKQVDQEGGISAMMLLHHNANGDSRYNSPGQVT